jgi:FtsH-binding integral membrane protein
LEDRGLRNPNIIARNVFIGFGWCMALMGVTATIIKNIILGEWFASYAVVASAVFFNLWTILILWTLMLATVLALYFGRNLHGAVKVILLTLFGLVSGCFMGPVTAIAAFFSISFNVAVLIAGAVFFVPALIGWLSRSELTHWFPWLLGLLTVAVLALAVNLFFPTSLVSIVVSIFVIALFIPLVIYDVNQVKYRLQDNEWQIGVVNLFLDLLNILIRVLILLLQVVGESRR